MITDETVKGFSVDTFREFVILEDNVILEDTDMDYGGTTFLSVDEALTLANRLTRAATRAAAHLTK